MATINLFIHAPSANISSERRLPVTIPLRELRGRLEGLTGVPPASQILSLHSTRTDDPDARAVLVAKLEDDERSLHDYGVQEGMGVVINDDRPADLASQFADDSKVEKWEMDDETYSKRRDTVLAYKQRNKLGRFDPAIAAPSSSGTPPPLPADLVVGARALVDVAGTGEGGRRGTVRFVGEAEFAPGVWVGVEYDEPVGKNDGSVGGKSYFNTRPKHGGFVRPEKVTVGDYPEEDLFADDDEDEEM